MASKAGKGDKRRPTDEQKYSANFDAIFRQKFAETKQQMEDNIKTESVVKKQLDKQEKV